MDKGHFNKMDSDKEYSQMTNFEREVANFQRDMEIIEIENRKRFFETRLYKWIERRKRKNGR